MTNATKLLMLAVGLALILALVWIAIGRYDLAVLVTIGNLPAAAFLIYRLRNDL